MIPKIIWQTHEWDYKDLPEVYKKTTSTWQNLNPGWEYRYLNASQRREMIKNIRPSLLDIYDGYSLEKYNRTDLGGMLQSDLWRIACIYEYGGVYADLDAICIGTMDQMMDLYSDKDIVISSIFLTKTHGELFKDSVLGINYKFKVNSGAGFAGKKNSVILKEILDILEGKKEYTENFQSDWEFSHKEWEIFNSVCTNSSTDLISYDFRWSVHSNIFNHKHSNLSTSS